MELESPADAWYVWMGVAIVSVALAGVAVSIPSTPPPDANAAANAVDRTSGSAYNATATYDHDADEVRLGVKQIALRNDGGTTRATVAFGSMTPVGGNESFDEILYGAPPSDHFADPDAFENATEARRDEVVDEGPVWRSAAGELRVRSVTWGDVRVTLVDA